VELNETAIFVKPSGEPPKLHKIKCKKKFIYLPKEALEI
jgi:hypothetical protein